MPDYQDYLKREPDAAKLKVLTRASWVVSILVFALVGLTGRYKLNIGVSLPLLPPLHAVLNTIVALSLVVAVIAIKNKNVTLHKRAIGLAVLCSTLFLISYVTYHITQHEVRFGGEGTAKIVYLALLASHILLATVSLPFILITLSLGATNHFARHRKMARWVFPLWLYVAATGPVCYLLLRPYY
jgi:putative membrane protein